MSRFSFASEREIQEQIAADAEACRITAEYLFNPNYPVTDWLTEIENLSHDVRRFGTRIRDENGLRYEF